MKSSVVFNDKQSRRIHVANYKIKMSFESIRNVLRTQSKFIKVSNNIRNSD